MKPLSVTALARAWDLQCARHYVWLTDGVVRPMVRLEDTEVGRALAAWGCDHEERVVERLAPPGERVTPVYPPGDLQAGAEATKELIRAGAPYIVQGVLEGDLTPGFTVRGIADLLERQGRGYRVVEIKASRRLKASQALQAVAYTLLLREVTETRAPILIDGLFREYAPPWEATSALLAELVTEAIPRWREEGGGVFHRSMRCRHCPFDPTCLQDARTSQHLSLVSGLGPAVAIRLTSAGVCTIPDLRATPVETLERHGVDRHLARRLLGQAEALVRGRVVPTGEAANPPSASVEMFLEVEPDPTGPLPCRLGLLKADRSQGLTAYRGVVVPPETTEAMKAVRSFLGLVAHQATKASRLERSWSYLYWGEGAMESLAEAVAWMGWGDEVLEEILLHATDIVAVVRRGWFLPVERWTLEEVVGAIGGEVIPDESCLALHLAWRRLRDASLEERMLRHGEARLRAMDGVWGWVASHAP